MTSDERCPNPRPRRPRHRSEGADMPPRAKPAAPKKRAPAKRPEQTNDAVLRCSGLEKGFGDRKAVNGVGFEIAAGETYGLLGPNGAGKTTTISMVCGLLSRDEGEVVVKGKPLTPS